MGAPDADGFETVPLDGGATLHHLATDRFKTVFVLVAFTRRLDERTAGRALLTDLLSRGTRRLPGLAALAARCEELFDADVISDATAFGPDQGVTFGAAVVADRYAAPLAVVEETVALLADLLHDPPLEDGRFRPDHFEQERTNLRRAIAALADDKGYYAFRRLMETMHGGGPFARHPWGTEAEAAALGVDDVFTDWRDLLERAPARVLLVGDVEPAAARAAAERLVGPARREEPAAAGPPEAPARDEVREARDVQPLSQSKLALGFRLPPEALPGPTAGLLASVLGGGAHSRLFKRVREAESLAYSCGALALPDRGTLVVQAGVDAAAVGRVREVVVEEWERLAREPVPDGEFRIARDLQRARLRELADAPRAQARFRLRGLATGRACRVADALAALDAVRPDALGEVARAGALDSVFVLEGRAS